MFAREQLDSKSLSARFPRNTFANDSTDPACRKADEPEFLRHAKNQASFFARLSSLGVRQWDIFPIWMLRDALEEPTTKGPQMESRLWVATEWVIKCADVILEFISVERQLDPAMARALRGGKLCEDMEPASLERWAFWKGRFGKLAGDVGGLEVDGSIVARITEALGRMDEVGKVGMD